MVGIRVSRRKLLGQGLATAAAAVGAGVVSGQARGSSAGETTRFVGRIESATGDTARVLVDGVGAIDLVLLPDAKVGHAIGDNPSADLSAFRVGDTIGFAGQLSDGVITTTSVQPVYTRLTAVVLEDTGDVIRTTTGPIRVSAATREILPPIERGRKLVAVVSSRPGDDPLLQAWDLR